MLIDSHCHLNFKAYKDDLSEVIGRCHQAGMKVINVGAAFDTSQKALEIAHDNDGMYAALGLHPIHVYDEEFEIKKYQDLINNNQSQVVAMGETGFDFWHLQESLDKGAGSIEEIKQKQEKVFRAHIQLAQDNDLALVIHGRNHKDDPSLNAYDHIYRVLKDSGAKRAVIHCYGGNISQAKEFVKLGFYLGFTGIVTFDKTGILEEIVKWIPTDKMLIETDAPYLSPEPHRGKRNEPVYVRHVAEKIAMIKGMSVDEVIAITGDNANELFNLK
ncbi:TatD family deoxyribonuclease [Candidatus Parcubacteria bacterium]|nr:MAG: TatD family deoxyribonuclease [Candidatus Parcubacteria bacterium]